VSIYNDGDGEIGANGAGNCPQYFGSRNLDDLAWTAQNRTITDFTQAVDDPADPTSFDLYKKIRTFAVYNGASSNDPGECNPETLLRQASEVNGGGIFRVARNPQDLEKALSEIFFSLSKKAASGTAASVLASGSGEGANLLQAVFYPEREFVIPGVPDNKVNWTGTLQNLWYYVDPRFGRSAIREDTVPDNIQHLVNDYITNFFFDTTTNSTMVSRIEDSNGDYTSLNPVDDIPLEQVSNLWEAGKLLWARDISPGSQPRNIKTTLTGLPNSLIDFVPMPAYIAALQPLLQAGSPEETQAIMRYTHGEDTRCSINTTQFCTLSADCPDFALGETCGFVAPPIAGFNPSYRDRSIAIDLNFDLDANDPGEEEKVWKLGDIVNSTPKVLSWVANNTYDIRYGDITYKRFTCNDAGQPCISGYDDRGMIFSAANDGMLHAFKLGKLDLNWAGRDKQFEFAKLTNLDPTTPLGFEEWAFIPRNALPYLKYIADDGYCHLFTNDGSPFVFDASIGGAGLAASENTVRDAAGNSWNTVLIGSMRYGGACRNQPLPCNDVFNRDCVKTPLPDIGYSSYYALDITDPMNPQLLWEFAHPDLGYSTAGASIVRISTRTGAVPPAPDKETNGEWFVVLPSGPTGPIDTKRRQFLGRSDQDLRIFVLDLRDGTLKHVIDSFGGAPIPNAFAGSSIVSSVDYDNDYQDDVLYIPYINSTGGAGHTFKNGGVVRLGQVLL
jgi:type IV pilus assembly protein PilY1